MELSGILTVQALCVACGLGSQIGITYLIKSKDRYKLTGKLLFACLIESVLV